MKLNIAPHFPETAKEQNLSILIVNMNDIFTCDEKGSLPYIQHNTIVMNKNNDKIVLSDNDSSEAFKEFKAVQAFHSNDRLCKQNNWDYTPDEKQLSAFNNFVNKYRIS